MSTYAMADIHGCYNELMKMLEKIKFSSKDTLIIAGDYIDRGEQNIEMLNRVISAPENIILLKGNHDEEFISYISSMENIKRSFETEMRDNSLEDTKELYQTTKSSGLIFDYYDTIRVMIYEDGITLEKMKEWSAVLDKLPYFYETDVNGKHFIIVHAGYKKNAEKYYYLYARDEAYKSGGKKDSIIVSGHTPTILKKHMPYNSGKIFRCYNEKINCTYYDIDCGAVYLKLGYSEGNMACIRLDDKKEFYLYE